MMNIIELCCAFLFHQNLDGARLASMRFFSAHTDILSHDRKAYDNRGKRTLYH